VVVSYIGFRENEDNSTFNPNILDTAMLVPVGYTHSLLAVHYGGVLSGRFLIEGQYSRLRSSIDQGGPELKDVLSGTWIFDKTRQARFHSPVGRPNAPEHYDNDSWSVKASYFLATSAVGGHDLRVGLERLANLTRINPYFSGSDYDIRVPRAIVRGTDVFPVLGPGTAIEYNPILTPSQGVRTATNSAFANDRVTLGRHWSLNLGVRYDKNDDRDGSGEIISRTGAWSPRLAVAFDPSGDGQLTLVAGYARYVSRNQDTLPVVWLPGGGQPAYFGWRYEGPCINCDPYAPTAQLVSTDEALRQLFAWFSSVGGPASTPTLGALIPGFSTSLQAGGLRSPSVQELSLGAGFVFGSHGYLRADLLRRDWSDLYSSRIDLQTGQTPPDPYGNVFDIAVIGNSNELVRRYEALQVQFAYSLPAIRIGGSYTLSRLSGNSSPEWRCCAAVPATVLQYPEYVEASWNHPTGYLSSFGDPAQPAADQRHRARLWIAGDLTTGFGTITPSLLESVDSGLPYEAVGFIDPTPWVNNPGYQTPPTQVAYFFSRPAAFRTDTITRTDVAVTWALPVGHGVQVFVKPEVLNLFNQQGVVSVDTTVATLEPFDPFHEKPVRGMNYELGPYFGKPTSAADYQLPRTFRFSAGIRF
ncbi:MAG TPA: TonB-dependent receptor, partial [Thermoanaerobaculaceae bacterium]|nr:TonB-dependent receptor [Thermoanaerobaculaceae bacterium]